jgi:hypothetical protein
MAFTEETLKNRFTYHKPTGDQAVKYEIIRNHCLDMALILNKLCPDSRELSLALAKLEEVVMWANAAIARNKLPKGD